MPVMKYLRAAQSRFPAIRPAKFAAYNWATRTLGWRIEPEFRLLARFAPLRTAVDVGGNWGQSVYALKKTARPERIRTFEPNPVLSRRLQRAFADDAGVAVESCALGETPGAFELFVPRYGRYVYDGLASLDEASARTWLNPQRFAGFRADRLHVDRYRVEVRTLDSFDLSPDVVKIDVQGLELSVVRGGWNSFRRALPITIVEAPDAELVALLGEIGLRAYGYADGRLVPGDTGGTNTIFLHDDRLAPVRDLLGVERGAADAGRSEPVAAPA